jgi:hypothetical protein
MNGMPYSDLREFIIKLGQEKEIVRVGVEVDIQYEIGAICLCVLSHEAHIMALVYLWVQERSGYAREALRIWLSLRFIRNILVRRGTSPTPSWRPRQASG